jgi:hypothetical protein
MAPLRIRLSLEDHSRTYHPAESLSGHCSVEGPRAADVRFMELSVVWYTEGKGDEDLSVHFFKRIESSGSQVVDFCQPQPFTTRLPNSPLSYSGLIVKICWCVRARVFLPAGKELSLEVPFQLGTVPKPAPVTP